MDASGSRNAPYLWVCSAEMEPESLPERGPEYTWNAEARGGEISLSLDGLSYRNSPHFGVVAAIHLREYVIEAVVVQTVRTAVNNLAEIPLIVWGGPGWASLSTWWAIALTSFSIPGDYLISPGEPVAFFGLP